MLHEGLPIRNLLCVVPYPANTGFAWNYIEGLYTDVAAQLLPRGVSTYVAYTDIDQPPATLLGSSAKAIALDARLDTLKSIVETLKVVRRLKIDTIYMTDFGMWHWVFPLLRMNGVRWIVSHDHTSGHRDRPGAILRSLKWVQVRLPGMTADRILTVSEYVSKRQREVGVMPASKVVTILNGVALPSLNLPVSASMRALSALNRPIVSCACRAAPEKGVHVLFRAFERMLASWSSTDARPLLVYAGDGPYLEELRSLRDSLDCASDITLLGYHSDVEGLLRVATICVVPSLWEDACPLGVLEPMAVGRPVIASAVGGVPEEINSPEVGVLVPKGDESALADAMRSLLLDDDSRKSIGGNARRRVANDLSLEGQVFKIVDQLHRGN